jgi:hypothetical protein
MIEEIRVKLARMLKPKIAADEPPEVYERRRAEVDTELAEAKVIHSALNARSSDISGYVNSVVSSSVAQMDLAAASRLRNVEREKARLTKRLENLASEIRSYPQVVLVSNELDYVQVRRQTMLDKTEGLQNTVASCKEKYSQASRAAAKLDGELKRILKENLRLQVKVDKLTRLQLQRSAYTSISNSPYPLLSPSTRTLHDASSSRLQRPQDSTDPTELRHRAYIEQINSIRSNLESARALVAEEKSRQNRQSERLYSYEQFFKDCMKSSLKAILKTSLASFEGNKALYFELITMAKAKSKYTLHHSITPDSFFGPTVGFKAISSINRRLRKKEKEMTLMRMGVTQQDFMQFDVTQVLWLLSLRPDVTKLLQSALFPRHGKQSSLASKQNSVDL